MKIHTYDCEVFKYNWLVVFKERETGQFTCIWDDPEALTAFLDDEDIHVGFNSKHYDQFIVKAIVCGYSHEEIKSVSDSIVVDGLQGWNLGIGENIYFKFNNVDVKDDMQQGQSLKSLEGHLGMPIVESSVPFDIDRPLTDEEKQEVTWYCKHDVNATEKIYNLRKDYFRNKINVGSIAGIKPEKAMSMTNAKLTARLLGAKRKEHDDERRYAYPIVLKHEYIPQEVFDFFDRMYDDTLSHDEVFKSKLTLCIGDCEITIAYGGIHGAKRHYQFKAKKERVLVNKDVASYYPNLMVLYDYVSRNIPSARVFESVLNRRLSAKRNGDKATSNALKLVINTTFGAMLNQYNDLNDPLKARSVCVTGQLFLLELAEHLYKEIENLEIVQLNTDGIMFECDEADLNKANAICDEWQDRTGFVLETDDICSITQKDVNNYVEVQQNGEVKLKGGYLVRGISTAGAFNINLNAPIVAEALKEFFVNGTPVEETIRNHDAISAFQLITKAGATYDRVYHIVDGEKVDVQKVNRIYATTDERYGRLYKVKPSGQEAKIENLPEHCIVDNENKLSLDDIDKSFYIEVAQKRVNEFLGIKADKKSQRRKKQMTTAAPKKAKNIYERLMIVREEFAKDGIEKNGKNRQLSSKFFTLDDIINHSRMIFHKNRILPLDTFTAENASLTLQDIDNADNRIVFEIPMREYLGNAAVTPVQAMGATVTYYRRYLYSLALDLAEKDELEEGFETAAPKAAKKSPATAQQRTEVKKELTAPDEKATDLQIKGLKTALKKLREVDPSKEDFITKLAVQTSGFSNLSKKDCEELIKSVGQMVKGAEK